LLGIGWSRLTFWSSPLRAFTHHRLFQELLQVPAQFAPIWDSLYIIPSIIFRSAPLSSDILFHRLNSSQLLHNGEFFQWIDILHILSISSWLVVIVAPTSFLFSKSGCVGLTIEKMIHWVAFQLVLWLLCYSLRSVVV
jgi:hypothetical protein